MGTEQSNLLQAVREENLLNIRKYIEEEDIDVNILREVCETHNPKVLQLFLNSPKTNKLSFSFSMRHYPCIVYFLLHPKGHYIDCWPKILKYDHVEVAKEIIEKYGLEKENWSKRLVQTNFLSCSYYTSMYLLPLISIEEKRQALQYIEASELGEGPLAYFNNNYNNYEPYQMALIGVQRDYALFSKSFHKCDKDVFYILLQHKKIKVEKDKDIIQELYNYYLTNFLNLDKKYIFTLFIPRVMHISKSGTVTVNKEQKIINIYEEEYKNKVYLPYIKKVKELLPLPDDICHLILYDVLNDY